MERQPGGAAGPATAAQASRLRRPTDASAPGGAAPLDFSWAVGDDPSKLQLALAVAAEALDLPPDRIFFLWQVHGSAVVVLRGEEPWLHVAGTQGDALVAASGELACGVRSADCVPILAGDRRTGAVAAIHAGWKGLVAGVIGQTLATLRTLAGSELDLIAAIGPHISTAAFEVSEDVAAQLAASAPGRALVHRELGPKPHVDLAAVASAQLCGSGMSEPLIDRVGGCTFLDVEDGFSYRRDGAASGRHLAAIVPRA